MRKGSHEVIWRRGWDTQLICSLTSFYFLSKTSNMFCILSDRRNKRLDGGKKMLRTDVRIQSEWDSVDPGSPHVRCCIQINSDSRLSFKCTTGVTTRGNDDELRKKALFSYPSVLCMVWNCSRSFNPSIQSLLVTDAREFVSQQFFFSVSQTWGCMTNLQLYHWEIYFFLFLPFSLSVSNTSASPHH